MVQASLDGKERPRVLLATEGTYPFGSGGVSTWCNQLCSGVRGVDFDLLAVTGQPATAWRYPKPPSVRRVIQVPLWPGEEPANFLEPGRYDEVIRRRLRTKWSRIVGECLPPLGVLVREITEGGVPAEDLVAAVASLGEFFATYDYKVSMRSRATWQLLVEALAALSVRGGPPVTLADATLCARWLYHHLLPLAAPLPAFSVFHASIAGACALPGIAAKRRFGAAFLLTEHGVYLRERYLAVAASGYSEVQRGFLLGLARAFARASYAAADVVAPVAAFNARWERRVGVPPERIRVLYNGVNTEVFRPADKPAARRRPTAVVAARVFPLKDIENLIRAAALARQAIPELSVLVYGSLEADPSYVAKCRALLEELGLGGTVELRGPHGSPRDLYLEGDISVLSSISEGFPYTVLESMACGVPCVATDVGGVREAVGETGIVVAPRAPDDLAEGMVRLLRDPELRRRLGDAAVARVREHFTLRGQLERYADLYREMHERAGAPASEPDPPTRARAAGPPSDVFVEPEVALARVEALGRLADAVSTRLGAPPDDLAVTAALESEGVRDLEACRWGYPDLFAMARDVRRAALLRASAAPSPEPPPTPPAGTPRSSTSSPAAPLPCRSSARAPACS